MVKTYVMDANALIEPHDNYYPFDFAEPFWSALRGYVDAGRIKIPDVVKEEILRSNKETDLSKWVISLPENAFIEKTPNIIVKYNDVMNHIKTSEDYTEKAWKNWSDSSVADPWIVAIGAAYDMTIVTFERFDANEGAKKINKPKIPNFCRVFGVEYVTLFTMLRDLSFSF